jgi:TonB family protein
MLTVLSVKSLIEVGISSKATTASFQLDVSRFHIAPKQARKKIEIPQRQVHKLQSEKKNEVDLETIIEPNTQINPKKEPSEKNETEHSTKSTLEHESSIASPQTNPHHYQAYLEKVYKQINSNKVYPLISRRKRQEGIVGLAFVIHKNGQLGYLQVVQRCGHKKLNQSAERAVKNASPFPAFPSSIIEEKLSIQMDVVFELR